MGYRVCANLEEAITAQKNNLLWLRYNTANGTDYWRQATSHETVEAFYGSDHWPPTDFAVLVEDEDSE